MPCLHRIRDEFFSEALDPYLEKLDYYTTNVSLFIGYTQRQSVIPLVRRIAKLWNVTLL